MTRVFVLDDHDFVRRSLKLALEADGEVEVVGEAGTVEEAQSGIPLTRPDVAVLAPPRMAWRVLRLIRSVNGPTHAVPVSGAVR